MIFNKNKPSHWITDLGSTLKNTKCKLSGKPIAFDEAMEKLGDIFISASKNRCSVWWVANGGSLAVCSHLSQDIINKLDVKSFVCSDPSLITCMANDFGYEHVYSEPLKRLVEKGDILIAISSSGDSQNIINAVTLALRHELILVTFSGFKITNKLYESNKGLAFYLPSSLYGLVEVGHEALLHAVIESLWLEHNG